MIRNSYKMLNNMKMARIRYLFVVAVLFLTLFVTWSQYMSSARKDVVFLELEVQKIEKSLDVQIKNKVEATMDVRLKIKDPNVKTVLIWTHPDHEPIVYLLEGQKTFIKRNCKIKSCFITSDKNYLRNVSDFDAIIFHGPELALVKHPKLPRWRSPAQKYVFVSMESSDYYPICHNRLDGYFNVSWTYKLNSDVMFAYLTVKNSEGKIIGPQKDMHWMSIDDMKPVNDTIKKKLSSKKKLAAWMVSNCAAPSGRNDFVKEVQSELKNLNTDMTIDVYGGCGTISCAKDKEDSCYKMFERDYYFYFSLENSFSEDYVTEKLLHPLQYYTVPVVFGAANYSRFMPDGIYLNGRELGPSKLARKMLQIANNKEQYYNYFKWINHYSYHSPERAPESDPYCKFCEAMNDERLINRSTVIENFSDWWNPPKVREKACA